MPEKHVAEAAANDSPLWRQQRQRQREKQQQQRQGLK
jgi:hypothetical protein